jgi:hypothetical protein
MTLLLFNASLAFGFRASSEARNFFIFQGIFSRKEDCHPGSENALKIITKDQRLPGI